MKGAPISIWLLLLLGFFLEGQANRSPYKHFDDYLIELDSEEQKWLIDADDEIEGSGNVDPTPPNPWYNTLPFITESTTKKKSTCCMLGMMAGDKGFHCYVYFYLARIMMRNRNRAHNKKIIFGNANEKLHKSREKLMMTFEQCVAGKGTIFHKCCYLAALKSDYNDRKHQHLTSKRRKY